MRPTTRGSLLSLLFALAACPDASSDDEDGGACVADDACKGDRVCSDGMCVDPGAADNPAGDASGASSASGGTNPGSEGGTNPGSEGGESPVPECSASDDPICADATHIEACADGMLGEYDCTGLCEQDGFDSLGCDYAADLGHDACLCVDAPYGACSSEADCSVDTPICVQFPNPMCSTSCGDDYDCPALPGQTVLCGGAPYDTYFCLVDCTSGDPCPTGTQCVEQYDGRSVCF